MATYLTGAAKSDPRRPHNAEPQSSIKEVALPSGLTSDEARGRLKKFGPNSVPDTALHPLSRALTKFWAPVPWMLEAAIVLEVVLGKYIEATIITGLLVFNAVLGYFQEGRAQATLAALKSRLALNASVRRDDVWAPVPAAELVPGDIVKLSLGAVVAADVRLIEGDILLDQSMLTGESMPIEAGPGLQTFAGALVRRGEAVAEVTATGTRTKFGRTAELVRTAHVESSQQKAVLHIVRNLAIFNGIIIVLLVGYSYALKLPLNEIISLVLTAVLASIPVALPATFTLAAALGARALAHLGILPTRLSAVDEAASIEVLCVDKTGTLTRNELKVTAVRPMAGFDESHVLGLAALASSDGGGDPVDAAIRFAASKAVASDLPKLSKFVPFDSAKKMSEATAVDASRDAVRVVKGAFAAVIGLTRASAEASTIANQLEVQGFRVLAVATGRPEALKLAGIIALSVYSYGGGTVIDPDKKVTINNPNAIRALESAKSWVGTISPAAVTTYSDEDARNVWQVGNAAFMRNWAYAYSLGADSTSPISGKFGVTILPKGDDGGKNAACLGGWQLMVSAYSRAPDAAADLVRYLTSPEIQKKHAMDLGLLPTIPALYSDTDLLRKNTWFKNVLDILANGVARPSTVSGSDYNQFSTALSQNVNKVLSGDESAKDAVSQIEQVAKRIVP
jgi:hypothetical protein